MRNKIIEILKRGYHIDSDQLRPEHILDLENAADEIMKVLEPKYPKFILEFCEGKATNISKISEWISIQDSLPKEGEEVLTTDGKGNYLVGYVNQHYKLEDGKIPTEIDSEYGASCYSDETELRNVTHYMHLTQPE